MQSVRAAQPCVAKQKVKKHNDAVGGGWIAIAWRRGSVVGQTRQRSNTKILTISIPVQFFHFSAMGLTISKVPESLADRAWAATFTGGFSPSGCWLRTARRGLTV